MAERAEHGEAARRERATKVAAVMRENLKKRKEQGRAREARDLAKKAVGDAGPAKGGEAGGG